MERFGNRAERGRQVISKSGVEGGEGAGWSYDEVEDGRLTNKGGCRSEGKSISFSVVGSFSVSFPRFRTPRRS